MANTIEFTNCPDVFYNWTLSFMQHQCLFPGYSFFPWEFVSHFFQYDIRTIIQAWFNFLTVQLGWKIICVQNRKELSYHNKSRFSNFYSIGLLFIDFLLSVGKYYCFYNIILCIPRICTIQIIN